MYANIKNNTVVKFPYSIPDLKADNPRVSFPKELSDDLMAEFGMLPVVAVAEPEYDALLQVIEEGVPVFNPVKQQWEQSFVVRPASPEEVQANTISLIAAYDRALTQHLDTVAQSRRYDNRITCALRAGYPGPFQAEGQAFAAWMDNCNASAYQQLGEIQAGNQPMPVSVAAFIASLPEIVWP